MEESEWPQQTSKIQVPKSWQEKTVRDVIGLFVTAYNKKHNDEDEDQNNDNTISTVFRAFR